MSMISSAVDSVGDLLVSIANLFVVRIAAKEADDDHNYGHAKLEGLGAMFEGGFIFAAAAFIIYEAVHKIIVGEVSHDSTLGILVMLPILALTIGTVTFLRKVAKETGSVVVKADAVHYTSDVWVNVGVLVALVLVKLTGKPVIDSIISIVIALSMFRASWHVVREGFAIVMDESLDVLTVAKLRTLLESNRSIASFHDLKTRVGKIPVVDFHVVVAPQTTTREVHDVYLELRARVRDIVGPTTKVLMHADPSDD
jgi:cation diffusion facilitator family transporter